MPLFTKKLDRPGSTPEDAIARAQGLEKQATLSMMDFSSDRLIEETGLAPESLGAFLDRPDVTWLHVQGQPSSSLLMALGEHYGLHLLALEDLIQPGQRTKAESYDDHYFLLLNIPVESGQRIHTEQVGFFLGKKFLISFHQGDSHPWEAVRQRLRNESTHRVRKYGPDYLLYALLDTGIDMTFPVLESLAEKIEGIEETIFADPSPEALDAVHSIRHQLIFLRRLLWPQRDMINVLVRDEGGLIRDRTKLFLRDCYDHTVQVMELIESYHEIASSLHDLYLSGLSFRMNEVMKVLTIIATIFIPLSFVVGLYGMNFDTGVSPWNMPELETYYGYPVLLLLMLGIGVSMVLYFKRKGWF
jgi:magnesium transporter